VGERVGLEVREILGGRGGTAGGKDVRRDGRERSRFQFDRDPSFSGEPERDPDGSPVNRRRGALCGPGTEPGIDSGDI